MGTIKKSCDKRNILTSKRKGYPNTKTPSPKLLALQTCYQGLCLWQQANRCTLAYMYHPFRFIFFFFLCRRLLMFALPPCPQLQRGWHCSVCCMSQIWSWMWSIIIRQCCKARQPWEEEGIVLQMGTFPLPCPRLLAIHPRWRGIILCFLNNPISCHWKGCFSVKSRSSLCVSLSCGWQSNLAVISANIYHLSWQHGQLQWWQMRLGLLCMLISSK